MHSALLGLLLFIPAALTAQSRCGVERWPVKIWEDDDRRKVDTVPTAITVAELARKPRPLTVFPQRRRVAGSAELQTFIVRARFVQALPQDDSDVHIVIGDLNIDQTIVTEIPHSGCTTDQRLAAIYDSARSTLRSVGRNDVIEITGIGFFDSFHGQRGMAPNGLELHPVLRLRIVSRARDSMPQARFLTTELALADSVWINTSSGVYHCPESQYFGRTVRGRFASEQEAIRTGIRAAGGRRCKRDAERDDRH
jgi:hypothetical protein